jgi:ABC-type glycerol-3-phosphate transport system substrate-binding protein
MAVIIKEKYPGLIIAPGVMGALCLLFLTVCGGEREYSAKYAGYSPIAGGIGRENIYSGYRGRYRRAPESEGIPIDIFAYTAAEGISELREFEGERRVLRSEEQSFVEWKVSVADAGLYGIYLEYFPLESRGIGIERSLSINGEIPFLGAERLILQRVWGDGPGGARVDNQGNEIRPTQVEKPRWEHTYLKDQMGYFIEPYEFYFDAGENTLRLTGVNEPLAIRKLELRTVTAAKDYKDYLASFDLGRFKNRAPLFLTKIQGEEAKFRSDPSLYGIYDRSSGETEPASVARIKLNMIGGQSWRVAGQWIEWDFEVPGDGLYRISVKARQNYNRGYVSNRTVLIDGEIPCRELAAVPFRYDNEWSLLTFSDDAGEALYFPLAAGKHSLRLQATLGDLGEILNVMEESVFRLNEIYRKILVLTGPEPDRYRDYRLEVIYPGVITDIEAESRVLYKVVDDLTSYAGERSSQAAATLTLARQLELFARRPDKIPPTLVNFKGNISTLGDSLMALANSQLDIDYLLVSAAGAELPRVRGNFFRAVSHEIRSFLASFFVDYNNLGDRYTEDDAVRVWMLGGRDQSSILKAMVDDTFTPRTGIKVNVKLVAADAVMPAVVAGTGPDAALSIGQGDPVNYAVRHAALDLSRLKGFDEAARFFHPSILIPFAYQGGVYGLPETQYFNVMFYRKDILEELGIEPPQTWDELINILPVIQKNNMNAGIPSVATASDFSNFLAQLYQRGGTLYNAEGSRTLLDGETAIEAFDLYTKFFTHYKTPAVYDFVNRFRTGEMPLGFADYTTFNTLAVFAPEIRGLWDFDLMPGVRKPDGSLDRSVPTGAIASMIFSNTKRPDLAWEFLEWWISADTQTRFGRELESIMGAAARYPTANVEAFERLSWGSREMEILRVQRDWTVGTPEVPGGYYVSRHIVNAVRRILNNGEDTRETLLDYSRTINDELIKKRKEFGLE